MLFNNYLLDIHANFIHALENDKFQFEIRDLLSIFHAIREPT